MSTLRLLAPGRRALVLAGLCVVAAASMSTHLFREDPAETFPIESSYAFDVTNLAHLAGYADNVFVGRVIAVDDVQAPQTVYSVEVRNALKGRLSGVIAVAQLGYRDGNDVWVEEEQPLLVVGGQYLLVTNQRIGSDVEVVLGGPAASVNLDNEAEGRGTDVLGTYRNAVEAAVYPPGVPSKD